jgi:hypothetical protein
VNIIANASVVPEKRSTVQPSWFSCPTWCVTHKEGDAAFDADLGFGRLHIGSAVRIGQNVAATLERFDTEDDQAAPAVINIQAPDGYLDASQALELATALAGFAAMVEG